MSAAGLELRVAWLGTVEYRAALAIQEQVRGLRQDEEIPDTLLLLEHPPVYTRGRRSTDAELPMGVDWYLSQGIDVVDVDRGGFVTYHGPGQLVGYPIVRTSDVVEHVRTMERAIVSALGEIGIDAHARVDDGAAFTGVWVGERKIASIGVHVQKGVTTHGFAVNVSNDLQPFSWVVPCAIEGVQMTSITRELGVRGEGLPCFRKRIAFALAREMGLRQRLMSAQRAGILAPALSRI